MKQIILLLSIIISSIAAQALKLEHSNYKDTNIYFVNFNPEKFDMQIARALGGGIGREDVLSIATRNGAIAAINGSFWQAGVKLNGIPAFILKVGNDVIVQKNHYPVVYFSKSGNVEFAKIHASPKVSIGSKILSCSINMPQSKAPIIAYTKAYGPTTLSNPNVVEMTVIEDRIIKISSEGNSTIPEDGFVLTANNRNVSLSFKIGMKVILDDNIPANIKAADYIMSGSNMLLVNGELDEYLTNPTHKGSFRDTSHARSALCKMKSNNIAFVATDYLYENDIQTMNPKQILSFLTSNGITREEANKMNIIDIMKFYHKISSQQKYSKGLNMQDFAIALQKHGCLDAINLDGGSSTTLIYKNKVIAGSKPQLQEDADAIILKVRK